MFVPLAKLALTSLDVFLNAPVPILVTLAGITSDIIPLFSKALEPIVCSLVFSPNTKLDRLVVFLNALDSIVSTLSDIIVVRPVAP